MGGRSRSGTQNANGKALMTKIVAYKRCAILFTLIHQGPATIDYAYWHGMIDSTTRDALWARWGHCFHAKAGNEPKPFHEFNTPDDCAISEGALLAAGATIWPTHLKGPNQYDVTTWDPYSTILVSHRLAAL